MMMYFEIEFQVTVSEQHEWKRFHFIYSLFSLAWGRSSWCLNLHWILTTDTKEFEKRMKVKVDKVDEPGKVTSTRGRLFSVSWFVCSHHVIESSKDQDVVTEFLVWRPLSPLEFIKNFDRFFLTSIVISLRISSLFPLPSIVLHSFLLSQNQEESFAEQHLLH